MSVAQTIPMQKVKSGNLDSVGHDPHSNELHVRFTSGSTYVYSDVHRVFYQGLINAESAGKYHAERIKGVFRHRKL